MVYRQKPQLQVDPETNCRRYWLQRLGGCIPLLLHWYRQRSYVDPNKSSPHLHLLIDSQIPTFRGGYNQ